ncbi:MAG: OB-fold nucleic acid binding domain-containing protein [Nitrospirae bacterium]|nr:OB-fold nucleic acid binding domain-containing protein [Nitrospirota bacterium]
MTYRHLAQAVIVLAVFMLAGCSGEKFGAGHDSKAPVVKVKDVMLYPEKRGIPVTLEGTISTQCMSNGCWFFLQDETGQIFINLAPNGMAIPPRTGKRAKVSGIAGAAQQPGWQIVATGVTIY